MALNDNNAMMMAASQAAARGGRRQSLSAVGRPYAAGGPMDPHSIGNAAMIAGMQPPLQISNGFGTPGGLQITNGMTPEPPQPQDEEAQGFANGGEVRSKQKSASAAGLGFGAGSRAADLLARETGSGPVRGPGTGTSDSVKTAVPEGTYIMPADSTEEVGEQNLAAMGFQPGMKPAQKKEAGPGAGLGFGPTAKVPVNLSNGEFRLSPEQVHAIGVQVLEGMKAATHEPAGEAAEKYEQEGPEGEDQSRPDLYFADGGLVEDPNKRPLATSPANTYPGNQAERAGNIYARSNADAASLAKSAFPGTTAAIQGASQAIQDAYRQGGVGAAVGQGFRGSMVPAVGLVDDAATGVRKLLDPAANALKTFVTGDSTPIGQEPAAAGFQPATATAKPASSPAVPSAPASANASPGANYGNEPNAAGTSASTSAGPSAQAGSPTAVPGVRRIDEPGKSPMFTNVEQGAAGAQPTAAPAAPGLGFRPGGSDVMGILKRESQIRAGMGELQDQINFNGGNGIGFRKTTNDELVRDMLVNGNSRDRASALGFMAGGRDAASRAAQVEQDQALRQAEMEGRQGIASEDLGLRKEAQGFQTRAAKRQEELQARYEAAKTPEERSAIAQQIRDLSGKEFANRFTVVPGGQEWDAAANAMRTVPARVINNQTGAFVDQPKAAASVPAGMKLVGRTPSGQDVYEDAQGKRFTAG